MGELDSLTMAANAGRNTVFNGFRDHNNGHRTSTELVMLEIIRNTHPDLHVTRASPTNCDLLGYATAGHATIITGEDENHDTLRHYKAPGPRLEGKPGILKDRVHFAQWKYEWRQYGFIVYEVEYTDPHSAPTKLFYLLSPRTLIKQGEVTPTDELLLAVGAWSTDLHDEIYVFDEGCWIKNKELWKSVQGSSWDEVILNTDMKANLISDVQGFFDNRTLYEKLAVPWKRGLIFHGVPGNGKTISIKALIAALACREDPVPSLYVKSFDAFQGQKYSIRSIFTHARTMAPCLLIFEDLDSLVTNETRSYFLNEVDGLESNDGILMIGSTNHLDTLDPAISKRPSRFDRKYHFKIPDEEERVAYADFWRKKLAGSDMVDFPEDLCPIIAKLADGFSFAYMKELFVIALLTIARGTIVEDDEEVVRGLAVSEDGKSSTTETPVMVEHESSNPPESTENGAAPITEEKQQKKAPKKRVLPEVETPESLKDNVLLKVIRSQMKMLLDEMDNTKEEDWPSDKKTAGGIPGGDGVGIRGAQLAIKRHRVQMSRAC